MTWAERFPSPTGPMPGVPNPADTDAFEAITAHNKWVKANRNAIVAKALDDLAESTAEASPADRIALVVGTAFLDGSLEPGLFGGLGIL